MKKILIILIVVFLVSITNQTLKAQNESLIEFSLDDKSTNDLQALNIDAIKDEGGIVSQTAVVSNNHHYDSKSNNDHKNSRENASITATDYLIASVWGLSVLLSSLYIRKIKRLN